MAVKASDNFKSYKNPNGPVVSTVTRKIIEKDGLYFNSGTAKTEEKPKKERVLSVVNRKKYGWILVLTGWLGGHHFYAKRYKLGLLYLVFFWSGFPAAMAIVDWLIWLPKPADENGNIEI